MNSHHHTPAGKCITLEYTGTVLNVPHELAEHAAMAVCSCGATRSANFLGPHVEDDTGWLEADASELWFRDWHLGQVRRSALILRGLKLARRTLAKPRASA